MDIFIEQLIQCKPDGRNIAARACLFAGMAVFGAIFVFAAFMFSGLFSVIALATISGVIWLGASLLKGLNVEYEYILTNKDLDIDKIIGRRKRKRLVTLDLSKAEKFGLCGEEPESGTDATVLAHDNTFMNMWSLTVNHDNHGKVTLLFNPSEQFALKLNGVLPSRVRNKDIDNFKKDGDGN